MDSRLTASLLSARQKVASKRLDVTIIHECTSTGGRAENFGDQLALEIAASGTFSLHSWNFRELGTRETRNAAASAAAAGDLVVFSMDGRCPLPTKMKDWVEMWIWLIDGHKPAVLVLFAAADAECAAVRSYLRRETTVKGLDFFVRTKCAVAETHGSQELSDWGKDAVAK